MTIYAVVNGMIHPAIAFEGTGTVWTLISPAAILQGGNPYFVPDFASRFEARVVLALRIGKLGKGIAGRFVCRYIDAAAPAVVFVAADRLRVLRDASMPWTSAISYDRSLAVGKFQQMPFEDIRDIECTLRLESSCASVSRSVHPCVGAPDTEEAIEAISRDNTLKTGDIILIGLSDEGEAVEPGSRATLLLNGKEMLRFNIR